MRINFYSLYTFISITSTNHSYLLMWSWDCDYVNKTFVTLTISPSRLFKSLNFIPPTSQLDRSICPLSVVLIQPNSWCTGLGSICFEFPFDDDQFFNWYKFEFIRIYSRPPLVFDLFFIPVLTPLRRLSSNKWSSSALKWLLMSDSIEAQRLSQDCCSSFLRSLTIFQ